MRSRLRESTRKRERLDTMRRFASGKSRPNREESSQRESESHKKSRASREKSTERRGSKRRDREESRSSNKGKRRSKGKDLSSLSRQGSTIIRDRLKSKRELSMKRS